jgi:hypothetical protein
MAMYRVSPHIANSQAAVWEEQLADIFGVRVESGKRPTTHERRVGYRRAGFN